MSSVVILVGASGSGKSTWAKQFIANQEKMGFVCHIVSADHYFEKDGVYQFDGTKLAQAHQACKRNFILAMQEEFNVIVVDNTNTRAWERKEYVQEARNHGYQVWLKVFAVPAEVCAERNQHGVPLEAVKKMVDRIDVPEGFYEIEE
jgi:predicted kinase